MRACPNTFNRGMVILLLAGFTLCGARSQTFELAPRAVADAEGIFLNQLLAKGKRMEWAKVKLAEAPAWGRNLTLNRVELKQLLIEADSKFEHASFLGAEQVEITRRSRMLEEEEMLMRLAEKLQPASSSGERIGELELRFRQDWKPIPVPAESIDLKILTRPSSLAAHFLVRFEVVSGTESIAVDVANLQARLMQNVWVARSMVRRGTGLESADFVREQRDVINKRDTLWTGETLDPAFWVTQPVIAGAEVPARAIEPRPVIFRNQLAQAVVIDQALYITMQVQILEDGAPGQFIRARNLRTRKEIRGKVLNEDTIQVVF